MPLAALPVIRERVTVIVPAAEYHRPPPSLAAVLSRTVEDDTVTVPAPLVCRPPPLPGFEPVVLPVRSTRSRSTDPASVSMPARARGVVAADRRPPDRQLPAVVEDPAAGAGTPRRGVVGGSAALDRQRAAVVEQRPAALVGVGPVGHVAGQLGAVHRHGARARVPQATALRGGRVARHRRAADADLADAGEVQGAAVAGHRPGGVRVQDGVVDRRRAGVGLDRATGPAGLLAGEPGVLDVQRAAEVGDGAARGAHAAYEGVREAYTAHGAELFRFALRSLGDGGAAEDVVQETFLRAWRSRHRYDPSLSTLRVWLFSIARNVVIDQSRATAARPWQRTVVDLTATGHVGEVVADPSEKLLRGWIVDEALRRLGEEHRHALTETYLADRPYAEVAAELGIPVSTLRSRVFYGLKALRVVMEEMEVTS